MSIFSLDDWIKDATDLVGGPDQRAFAEFGDIAQQLADSGLNLGALAQAEPEEARAALSGAGLPPEILEHPKVIEWFARLRGE